MQLGIICDPNFRDPLEFGVGFPFGGIEPGLVIAMANYTGSHQSPPGSIMKLSKHVATYQRE